MRGFLDIARRAASVAFERLGDKSAVLIRQDGTRAKTKAVVKRGSEVEAHLRQSGIVATVPVCLGEIKRGDKLRAEGGELEVVKELERDQHVIWLQMKDLGPL